ncbi:MAG: hypothetical protein IPK08_04345 [Bacteroidetes bacterium]|nr:hypothetical protein [Bacteroidota bacterium]
MKKNPTSYLLDRRKLRLFSMSILLGLGMLLSNSSFAQVLYSVSNLTGVGYTPISGGTIINSTAQLTPGSMTVNQDDGSALITLPFTDWIWKSINSYFCEWSFSSKPMEYHRTIKHFRCMVQRHGS